MDTHRWTGIITVLVSLAVGGPLAFGSGFAIMEQSASGMGSAYSGMAARGEDATCIFYNPACMTDLEGRQVSVAGHLIMPRFEFENEGSVYPLAGGLPVCGGDGGNGGRDSFVADFCYAQDLNDQTKLGLGIHSPFGLVTEYDSGWVGRYQGLRTELATLNINPSVAWRLSKAFSLGFGLSAQYVEAELTSAVDFGSILAAQGAATVPGTLDGDAKVEGDDWGFGGNLGLLCEPRPGSRIGLSYRSMIESTLEGDATFCVPPQAAALQAGGLFVDTSAQAGIEFPETVSLGLSQKVGDALVLQADVTWTHWSRFEELRIEYDSAQQDSVTEEEWDDTFRYALGLQYLLSRKWTLRAGAAYDETPIPDSEHRTPRIPDGDRTWLTLGAGCRLTDDLTVDAAYLHLFFNDSDVDHLNSSLPGDLLAGSYEGSADVLSLQVNLAF